MASRASIIVVHQDNTVSVIYLHNCQGQKALLQRLNGSFRSQKIASELVQLGNLSTLGFQIHPSSGTKHNFDNPQDRVNVYYNRDRGEELRVSRYGSVKIFESKYCSLQETSVIFKNGKWEVYNN